MVHVASLVHLCFVSAIVPTTTQPADTGAGMTWLEFLASLASSCAWPAVTAGLIGGLAYCFRTQVSRLLLSLQKLDIGSASAAFRDLNEAAAEIQASKADGRSAPSGSPSGGVADELASLGSASEVGSPQLLIGASWGRLVEATAKAVAKVRPPNDYVHLSPTREQVAELRRAGQLSRQDEVRFAQLDLAWKRLILDRTAGEQVSRETALSFARVALAVRMRIDRQGEGEAAQGE